MKKPVGRQLDLFPPVALHRCHARGCEVEVPPEMLMCHRHWRRVPYDLQRAVWRSYRDGQCADRRPSREWFFAADAAIGYVAWLDGAAPTDAERDALERAGITI